MHLRFWNAFVKNDQRENPKQLFNHSAIRRTFVLEKSILSSTPEWRKHNWNFHDSEPIFFTTATLKLYQLLTWHLKKKLYEYYQDNRTRKINTTMRNKYIFNVINLYHPLFDLFFLKWIILPNLFKYNII